MAFSGAGTQKCKVVGIHSTRVESNTDLSHGMYHYDMPLCTV